MSCGRPGVSWNADNTAQYNISPITYTNIISSSHPHFHSTKMSPIDEYAAEEIFVLNGAKPSTANGTHFINAGLWEQGIGAKFVKQCLI